LFHHEVQHSCGLLHSLNFQVKAWSGVRYFGFGINIRHFDKLSTGSLAKANLSGYLMEPSIVEASLGYAYSRKTDEFRVVVRLYKKVEKHHEALNCASHSYEHNCINDVLYMLTCADHNTVTAFIHQNGVQFLFNNLLSQRLHKWSEIQYGGEFFDKMINARLKVRYSEELINLACDCILKCIEEDMQLLTAEILSLFCKVIKMVCQNDADNNLDFPVLQHLSNSFLEFFENVTLRESSKSDLMNCAMDSYVKLDIITVPPCSNKQVSCFIIKLS